MSNLAQINSPLPVIAGVEITTDGSGRFNLNALHKAAGGEQKKRPKYWLNNQSTKELIDELRRNSALDPISTVRGGLNSGTFAHELLAVSYAGWISPKFQLQVNQVFIDYKTGRTNTSRPMTTLEALEAALNSEKARLKLEQEKQELECQILEFKPKVEALDRIATAHGSLCIRDAAKTLQERPIDLKAWMIEHRWVYVRKGATNPIGFQARIEQGLLEHKETEYEVNGRDGEPCLMVSTQVRITPKGLAKIAEELRAH